jgi:hypothetical protein
MRRKPFQIKQHRVEIVFSGYDFLDQYKFVASLNKAIKNHLRLLEEMNKDHLEYRRRSSALPRMSFRWQHLANTPIPREK